MNARRFTIKDVSSASGLSIGTISRYINQKGYVSKESAEKIEKAIEKLGYIPSAAARNMINKKSRLVGVAVPEMDNPFLGALMVQIESSLCRLGYSVMLCNTGFDPEKTESFVNDLIMRNAEGIILAATDVSWTGSELIAKINSFMAGVSVGQKIPNFDCINFSDVQIAEALTEHLIAMGHTKIGCIAYNQSATQTLIRRDSVQQTLRAHGLPVKASYFVGFDDQFPYVPGENGGYLCARKLLEQRDFPTALIAVNDYYAMGAYKAVEERGLAVGRDISIAGFDNVDLSRFINPALTTVDCDVKHMAEVATELLDQKIANKSDRTPQEIVLPAQVICRNSVRKLN